MVMNPNSGSHTDKARSGSAKRVPLRQALRSLYDTLQSEEKTLDCDECQRLLTSYTEVEQPGTSAMFAQVHLHLASCPLCTQMYVDRVGLEKIEAMGRLPALSTPVQFDLSMLHAGRRSLRRENRGVR